ncbi:hypothetical protein BDZ97DRAFT_1761417 [Flammula alnicola]|nr:hypothetical protein BDZ97DRAFT_1761417 [Flammula alnicola]
MDILDPGKLAARYEVSKRERIARQESEAELPTENDEEWIEDEEVGAMPEELSSETGKHWALKGFARNTTFTLVFVISMMTFTRNSACNLFALIMGLFLDIGGTGSQVISTMSNAGVCVSVSTIERLKKILSDDAKKKAVDLMKTGTSFFSIFDNINIYLRKHQQRLFNSNSMIHATNAAVIAIPDIDKTAEDLKIKLDNRGKRANATGADILPTAEDQEKIYGSYVGLVMHMIISYCPGSSTWKHKSEMINMANSKMASDRPLPPEKTDARPLGVFDINEGSKKGIIKMLQSLQETSTLSKDEWAGKTHIVADPGSLAKHKGLLNRTWDAAKPNYADGKALIRHSLIARILYSIMLNQKMTYFSELSNWKPSPEELSTFAHDFVDNFTSTKRADEAKAVNDDYLAHSIYFIRDALMFCEFEHAVSFADTGRILRVFKFWSLSFRGAGLHNYARECLELLVRWKYELDPPLRAALERSWFVNRWGLPGRWIAADLYVEQLNFWVKRVFIAKGAGVTVQYIIEKGSACVEIFREISHKFARTFGHSDHARRHKEVNIEHDLRLLSEGMLSARLHIQTPERPVQSAAKVNRHGKILTPAQSMIIDCYDLGAEILNDGKFDEFICTTTWDPAVGFQGEENGNGESNFVDVLLNGTTFDSTRRNPISTDDYNDVDDGDDIQP